MLARRCRVPVLSAVERLVGMQAQVPRDPYVALWSRLDRFRAEALSGAIRDRLALRIPFLRSTLHLVSDRDALALYPVIEPARLSTLYGQSGFGRALDGLDVEEVLTVATELLEEQPRTRAELAPLLAERWPNGDGASLSYAVSFLLPLVQVTPRGLWRQSGPSAFTTMQAWLGRPLDPDPSPDEMVLRYLAAFGPSTVADVQSWSGLTGMRTVIERLRPRLLTFRDERGRELLDVPGAPLPDPDTPAQPRFLPEYDNVFLGHADRTRIVSEEDRKRAEVGWGSVLVDGFIAARWRIERERDLATLLIEPYRPLHRRDRTAVSEEGARLLAFAADDAESRDLRLIAPT
jgi:hypothetical protein